jgi:nucleoside-diphosphate-sugar epimerase
MPDDPTAEVTDLLQHLVGLGPVPQDPTSRRPDLTLAKRIMPGWGCVVSYEEGVDRTLDWFRSELSEVRQGSLKDSFAG